MNRKEKKGSDDEAEFDYDGLIAFAFWRFD